MTTDTVLGVVLDAAEGPGRTFGHAEVSSWPQSVVALLERTGVLREATGAPFAECPDCDDRHVSPVEVHEDEHGRRRYYIACPAQIRTEVSADACRSWGVDPEGLARQVSAALGIKALPALVSGRLWRLGGARLGKSSRQVLLSLDGSAAGAERVAKHVGLAGRGVVVVPVHSPDSQAWHGRVPAVIALDQVSSLGPDGLEIDTAMAFDMVRASDNAAEALQQTPESRSSKQRQLQRAIRTTIKEMTTLQDVLDAAREGGTTDEIHARLMDRGHRISRSTVGRRLKAAAEQGLLRDSHSSESVQRAIPSHRRDGRTRIVR